MARNSTKDEEDVLSYCGSIAGETFSSRHSRRACSLRQHSIDIVAQKLREFPFPVDVTKIKPSNEETIPKKRFNESFHHYRLLVVILAGLSFGLMIMMRFNISVSILSMVNQTALYMHEHPNKTVDDFLAEGYQLGGDFDWDNKIQNIIMSWYMIAYTLPQVGATKLGITIGSRIMTPIALFICAVATILTPLSAYWGGWQWVVVMRLINGVGASAVLPMMLNLIENWMPYDEITLGLTLSNMFQTILASSSPIITGYLSSYHWSYSFYVPGVVTLLFCVVWLLLVTNRPDENWLISQKELDLICDCNRDQQQHSHQQQHNSHSGCKNPDATHGGEKSTLDNDEQNRPPTLFDVLKVPSFYAYIVCVCVHCSAANGFAFILPAYLRQFMKINISENGFYTSIIQSGLIISVMWPHPMLYFLQSKLNLSLTTSRRITYAIGCFIVGFVWVHVGAFHQYELPLLWLGRCFHGVNDVVVTGSLMSNYAKAGLSSLAFSLVNTVGNFSVVLFSTFVGWYLDYSGQSEAGWFHILLGLGLSQVIMMTVFGTLIRSDPIEFEKQKKEKSTQA